MYTPITRRRNGGPGGLLTAMTRLPAPHYLAAFPVCVLRAIEARIIPLQSGGAEARGPLWGGLKPAPPGPSPKSARLNSLWAEIPNPLTVSPARVSRGASYEVRMTPAPGPASTKTIQLSRNGAVVDAANVVFPAAEAAGASLATAAVPEDLEFGLYQVIVTLDHRSYCAELRVRSRAFPSPIWHSTGRGSGPMLHGWRRGPIRRPESRSELQPAARCNHP